MDAMCNFRSISSIEFRVRPEDAHVELPTILVHSFDKPPLVGVCSPPKRPSVIMPVHLPTSR